MEGEREEKSCRKNKFGKIRLTINSPATLQDLDFMDDFSELNRR